GQSLSVAAASPSGTSAASEAAIVQSAPRFDLPLMWILPYTSAATGAVGPSVRDPIELSETPPSLEENRRPGQRIPFVSPPQTAGARFGDGVTPLRAGSTSPARTGCPGRRTC